MTQHDIVYIIDDDAAIRKSLAMLLKTEGLTTYPYDSAETFLAELDPTIQGCLLLDVRMPGMSGLDLQQRLKQANIALPLIIMTGHGDIPMAVRAMKAGAMDFIEKPFDNKQLLALIHQCLTSCDVRHKQQQDKALCQQKLERLTPREHQVMELLVDGLPNKLIAARLTISRRTVELHRARVMEKLETHSLSEVVRIALLALGPETIEQ